jgi:oligopeptide transport system substrate-binding protein
VNYGLSSSSDVSEQLSVQYELEKADTFNDKERYQVYQQLEQQLVNDVAWMPVFQWNSTFLLKTYVQGFDVNGTILSPSQPIPPDDWARIYIAAH